MPFPLVATLSALFTRSRRTMGRYTLAWHLLGHTGPIHTVSISADGRWLASGGSDGLHMWDMLRNTEILALDPNFTHNPVSCTTWTAINGNVFLVFRTGLGHLGICGRSTQQETFELLEHRRIGNGKEIVAVAFGPTDHYAAKFVTGTRNKLIHVWSLQHNRQLISLFTVELPRTVPIGLSFVDNASHDIRVVGIWDGKCLTLSGTNGVILLGQQISHRKIGSTAVHSGKNTLVIDNVINGFSLYRLDTLLPVRTFPTGEPLTRKPKQSTFGEEGKVIVGGSDHGCVYIFDRKTGAPLDVLRHSYQLVQAVATHISNVGTNVIVTASNDEYGDHAVSIWIHKPDAQGTWLNGVHRVIRESALLLWKLFCQMLLGIALYIVWQNLLRSAAWEDPNAFRNIAHRSLLSTVLDQLHRIASFYSVMRTAPQSTEQVRAWHMAGQAQRRLATNDIAKNNADIPMIDSPETAPEGHGELDELD
ncbi:uncharacterized protein PHACADRAFT_189346 [Phanerochaete carnosa HHB-10118-sp]|uniref:WD40 repeat-like protein n=1 Tax=Phanerochaete carnosa (strain HHB-10118-sp) TaxID=650164 RepID=K5VBD4_PHACS|nr:uncharacterized protein PHACADRAFT_189346 [Phanerochaete carnosa HHB-10118-sp]EKM60211.1 hypothetical protein PHACADRAFT_189346 [Phanerochaete carnosa HHB-10118-sp]